MGSRSCRLFTLQHSSRCSHSSKISQNCPLSLSLTPSLCLFTSLSLSLFPLPAFPLSIFPLHTQIQDAELFSLKQQASHLWLAGCMDVLARVIEKYWEINGDCCWVYPWEFVGAQNRPHVLSHTQYLGTVLLDGSRQYILLERSYLFCCMQI